ncbi:MAG: valine--tRNA ligase [Alphaproteobacteria bacterium]
MTEMDKTFDPATVEDRHYKQWEADGAFAANPDSNAKPWTIMIPPPNVTGSLHMGHALNMSLQDILTRYNRMQGHDALWQPGTDHAGIATQMIVQRQLADQGIHKDDLGREAFIDKIWEWKEESGGQIVNSLRRLGASPDWSRERFTLDEGLSKAVRKVFVQLHKEGLIYRDKRLVNWDPNLHTALSDLEVEMIEKQGHMWHLKYPLADDPDTTISVATTRPETMLGDTGVAVHPEDERYKHLIGKMIRLPIVGREIPIVADEHADPEQGSGAVKITPAHDFNDFEVGKRAGLEVINIMDRDAKLNENVPADWQGLDRFEARKKVIAWFEDQGMMEKIDTITHTIPYDEKTKSTILEPWLTDQWFVDAHTLAQPAIKAVEDGRTKFVPENWTNTYYEWMRNIQPWCISRQIWWGHQIPAWYGPDGEIFVAETEQEAQAAADKHYGSATELTRDSDVLDTWFSSALWPFSTLGWPEQTKELERYYPTDTLITGFDIIFFWVARMMMMGLHFMGDVPFRTVYIHALVRDEHGQKMSKTKGNVIDPLEVMDEYGTDALRFTLASMAAQGRDIKLATDSVKDKRNFATKIWNAARFCAMNGAKPVPGFDPSGNTLPVNRWIVSEVVAAERKTREGIENYRFSDAASALFYLKDQFCDWFIEAAKPVLTGDEGAALEETRATAAWVIDQMLHMLHPIMPFLSEEIYEQLGAGSRESKLCDRMWPDLPDSLVDQAAADEINWAMRFIQSVRSIRAEMNLGFKAELKALLRDASDETMKRAAAQAEMIQRLCNVTSITRLDGTPPAGSAQAVVDEAAIFLPLGDVIDFDKERVRLSKQIDNLKKDIEKIDKKLGNENFLSRAPADVVEEQKSRKSEAEATIAKLNEGLARLEGV